MQSTRSNPKGRRVYEYLCGRWNRGKRNCNKGAVPQRKLEAVVIKTVVDFYKQYRGSKGHERCLQAIQQRVKFEMKVIAAIKRKLRTELKENYRNLVNPSQCNDSISPSIANQNMLVQNRKRLLFERRLESLNYIALSKEEIPELLERLQDFVGKLHDVLLGTDQEERLAAIRRCVVGISVDTKNKQAQIELRELPTIISVLDADRHISYE